MSHEVTVGVDIGTTSVKAIAADPDGTVLARARVPHRLSIPAPDRMEHDAAQAWRRGPARALAALGLSAEPSALAVSSMVPSLTAVDRRGRPITPGLLYGDGRGRTDSADSPATSGEAVQFLRWTAHQAPDAFGYWPAPAVANFALGGVDVVDSVTAFSSAPLFGLSGWDDAIAADCGVKVDQLPRVENTGAPIGTVKGTGITLGAGCIDAMGEQILAGADADGDVLVICGTTLIVWAVITGWIERPGVWTIPHTAPGKCLIGGPSNSGGLFLNWATRLFRGGRDDRVDPNRVPVFAPYIRGERAPLHDPDRRATLDRLDLTLDAAACRRAAYEAAGFAARHLLDLGGGSPRRIVATGGGTRVGPWVQALADCTQLPVDVVAVPEGGALGSAWFARMALGLETTMVDAARWARLSHRVEPDPGWAGPVADRYLHYRRLADDRRI